MAKKSRNNRRKTAGKFTTNPTQYLPLCNPIKYDHTYDRATGFITVKNIRQDRVVGVFYYPELYDYLGMENDVNKMFDISDSSFPSSSINANPGK